MKNIVIGLTDCAKYKNYERWFEDERGIEIIKLSYRVNNISDIEKCSGVVFTGGEDIHPGFYNKPEYVKYCHQKNIDQRRDEFEWKLVEKSHQQQIPVLGICRGLQIANVFFGGTLIPDNTSFGKTDHSRIMEGADRYHEIKVMPKSLLQKIVNTQKGEINSAHHQSIDIVADSLVVNAMSPDEIIEGMERKESEGKSFFMLVQWHPERMTDQESVFSKNIKQSFLEAVRNTI